MFLAARIRMALLAVAVLINARPAVATEPTPTAECIAASESGQDLRHAGKLLDARKQFEICVAASCPAAIREDCAQNLDEIARAIPSMLFNVTDSVGNDVPSVTITMDGQVLATSAGAIEVDPGKHVFTFEAQGLPKVEKRLVLVDGVKQRREVVIMDRNDAAPTTSTASPATDEASTQSAFPPTLSLVAFGVGGAGLALGVIAGVVAGGKHSTLERECDNTAGTCLPAYADDLDSFHTWRTISTVGYVVGALGVAGGAVLWFSAPKTRDETATAVWLGPASAGVAGRF